MKRRDLLSFAARAAASLGPIAQPARMPGVGFLAIAPLVDWILQMEAINDVLRHGAVYVDEIPTGAKPADLPIELPNTVEFVVNLKAAKGLDITVPPALLLPADRVIV